MTSERKNPRSPGKVNELLFNQGGLPTGDADLTFDGTTLTVTNASFTTKVGFYGVTPITRPAAIANITTTATTGSLPTANGSVTIANAATPTVVELLDYCVELETKLETLLATLRNLGLLTP